jgi:hypothetical protein
MRQKIAGEKSAGVSNFQLLERNDASEKALGASSNKGIAHRPLLLFSAALAPYIDFCRAHHIN